MTQPIASIKPFCSMPHGRYILIPITLSIIAFGISLRSVSRCDFLIAKWSFGCNRKGECKFNTKLPTGLFFKETIVNVMHNGLPIRENQCRPYLDNDDWILQEPMWKLSRLTGIASLISASISILFLCSMFTVAYKKFVIRFFSVGLFLAGFFNLCSLAPLISKACTAEGSCNPEKSYCMKSCTLDRTAWFHIASSFVYIACCLIAGTIPPYYEKDNCRGQQNCHNELIIPDLVHSEMIHDTIKETLSTDSESTTSTSTSDEYPFQNEISHDIENAKKVDNTTAPTKQ